MYARARVCVCACQRQTSLGTRRVWCVNVHTRCSVIRDLYDKSSCKSEIDSFLVKTPRYQHPSNYNDQKSASLRCIKVTFLGYPRQITSLPDVFAEKESIFNRKSIPVEFPIIIELAIRGIRSTERFC